MATTVILKLLAVDYTKALSGDPCVIFEHSLTFQPWE
ncbi:hypothetical protein Golax_009807 [Gossypium laxum]|uniref:Uncharacterized protein n=1 Tax=Gossypium laxum TaxID=34288 RepID=A0A7J8ZF93_9ROSI|nr:hypothetical protein [Gossypium laxum]